MQDLMASGMAFSRIMEEYGSLETQKKVSEGQETGDKDSDVVAPDAPAKATQALMQDEERVTGAVSWSVYYKYLHYTGDTSIFLLILFLAILFQCAQGKILVHICQGWQLLIVQKVADTLFLGFWTSSSIHSFSQADYMGIYAALGIANGLFAFLLTIAVR